MVTRINMYSSNIEYKARGTIDYDCFGGYYCFGGILQRMTEHGRMIYTEDYTLYLHGPKYPESSRKRHEVLVSVKDIDNYLSSLQELYGDYLTHYELLGKEFTTYRDTEEGISFSNCLPIRVTITGTRFNHLWILTNIRSLYEYPHNAILRDILYLKKNSTIEELRNESILNLHQILLSTHRPYYYEDQSLFYADRKLVDTKYIQNTLKISFENPNDTNFRVLRIYDKEYSGKLESSYEEIHDADHGTTYHDTDTFEYWLDEHRPEKLLELEKIYFDNWKILK